MVVFTFHLLSFRLFLSIARSTVKIVQCSWVIHSLQSNEYTQSWDIVESLCLYSFSVSCWCCRFFFHLCVFFSCLNLLVGDIFFIHHRYNDNIAKYTDGSGTCHGEIKICWMYQKAIHEIQQSNLTMVQSFIIEINSVDFYLNEKFRLRDNQKHAV